MDIYPDLQLPGIRVASVREKTQCFPTNIQASSRVLIDLGVLSLQVALRVLATSTPVS
jgi:hypothetical protein